MAFPHPKRVWRQYLITTYRLQYGGAPSDATTYIEALGQVDPTFWLKEQPVTGRFTTQLDTSDLPTATRGGLRVGDATGGWTTLAKYPMDMEELPAIQDNPDKPQEERTGFNVVLTEDPQLVIEGEDKPINLTGKIPKGNAVRAVAVLNTGEHRVLTVGMSGKHRAEICPVPARHGESTENYSHLIASQVKEIQIQTRPYEWAEFHGIALSPN